MNPTVWLVTVRAGRKRGIIPTVDTGAKYNAGRFERWFLISALAAVAVLVSSDWIPCEPTYYLEDKSPHCSPLARWDGPSKLLYENTLAPDDLDSVEGYRLSVPGEWSLSVGDRIEEFDRRLGVPVHVGHTVTGEGTLTARYRFGEHDGLCVVTVDCQEGVATRLTLYRWNLWSMSTPPLPFAPPEVRETPGAWLSYPWCHGSDHSIRDYCDGTCLDNHLQD